LDEFNKVRLTESPADFGQQLENGESYDSEKLWRDAAIFEYEVSNGFGFIIVAFLLLACLICLVKLY